MAKKEFSEETFRQDFQKLFEQSLKVLNDEHNYIKAYDLATQAKLLAEKYLEDDISRIECDRLRGIAYLKIDRCIGHDILEKLRFDNKNKLKDHKNVLIGLELAYGDSKSMIGEYDEAIRIFKELYESVQKDLKVAKEREENSNALVRIMIKCYTGIIYCLIYKKSTKELSCKNETDGRKIKRTRYR